MANLITHRALDPTLELALHLSNGGTAVLLSVLLLAGTPLAATEWERRLLVWLATRDQAVVGSGMVGFDLGHIAWSRDAAAFAGQKAFVLRMVERAQAHDGWERLGYEPPHVDGYLVRLRALVEAFALEHVGVVDPPRSWAWPDEQPTLRACAEHRAALGAYGTCLLCNDRVVD